MIYINPDNQLQNHCKMIPTQLHKQLCLLTHSVRNKYLIFSGLVLISLTNWILIHNHSLLIILYMYVTNPFFHQVKSSLPNEINSISNTCVLGTGCKIICYVGISVNYKSHDVSNSLPMTLLSINPFNISPRLAFYRCFISGYTLALLYQVAHLIRPKKINSAFIR